jgi:hypothetical protein
MRYIVSLLILLAAISSAQVLHAQGNLTIDVSGVPGSNVSTWTFSGSYTVGDVLQIADTYSVFSGSRHDDDNINNFHHESDDLTGGIGVAEGFNLEYFLFLSSTAQVSGSQSGVHFLDGIFLDSDDPITGDDLVWYAPGTFQDGETVTFSGTATIALDINLFLAAGDTFRSISSDAGPSNNPADFTMNFTAASETDPSVQIDAIGDAVEALETDGTISSGLATSLSAKLDAARDRVDDQPQAAVGMLRAFIQQVTALVETGRLNLAYGENLTTAAQNVIAGISTD